MPLAVEAADLFELGSNATALELFDLCAKSPLEELEQTQHAQPCQVVTELAAAAVLKKHGLEPDMVAGAGAGEYAAHALAGTIDNERTMELVGRRGAMAAMVNLLGERGEANARRNMELALKGTIFIEPQIPLYAMATGELIDIKEVNAALLDQFPAKPQWGRVIAAMAKAGAERFVQCGPGESLRPVVEEQAAALGVELRFDLIDSAASLTAAGI